MIFYVITFICNMVIPVVMLIGGFSMYKNPPKEINGAFGYRTKMSRKNKDTWQFANNYCGMLWLKLGGMMLLPTVLIQVTLVHTSDDVMGVVTIIIEAIQLVALFCSIIPVEVVLRRTFDKDGNRK